ncbi:MAG: hypothetical protein ACLSS9_03910 [Acutalibacteraceae bacterium]
MKTYEEIAAELFDRRDAYYARRARQRKMALAAASGLCCMALAVLLGFGLRHNMETIPAAGESSGTAAAPAVSDSQGAADSVENGFIMQRPDDDNSTVSYTPMISAYEGAGASCYMTPENGQVRRSIPLNGAIKAYGGSARYNVRIDVFRDQQLLAPDSAEVRSEIERLAALGYTTVFETYDDGANKHYTFSCHATQEQLLGFPVNTEYGYFLFLYEERD